MKSNVMICGAGWIVSRDEYDVCRLNREGCTEYYTGSGHYGPRNTHFSRNITDAKIFRTKRNAIVALNTISGINKKILKVDLRAIEDPITAEDLAKLK